MTSINRKRNFWCRRLGPGAPPYKLLKSYLLTTPAFCRIGFGESSSGESRMFRWLKALSLTLALAALSLFAASCGNNGSAQIRFVHAIQDAPALDIDVNGTQKFNNISFLGVLPNQPGYTSVPSGTDTLAGLVAGSTTQVFSSTVGWSSSTSYTVVGTGFSKTGTNGSNVVL